MQYRYTVLLVCLTALPAVSQEPAPPAAPTADRPEFKAQRIGGLVPNYKTVEDREIPVPRLSARDKWRLAALSSFDPMTFVVAGLYAGIGHYGNQYPGYGRGASGFGKRYGAAVGEQVVGHFMTEAVVPTLLRMDPRYYRMARGGGWKRTGWALSRTVVAPTDSGRQTVNFNQILGKAGAVAVTSLYLAPSDRTFKVNTQRYSSQLAGDAVFNLLKEFWPDIHRKVFRKK
jgi:hypothetical protein